MTLSEYLAQPKITAVGIARALKVSHSTVLRWAENRVPADRVGALAKITGLLPSDLRPDLASAFIPTTQPAHSRLHDRANRKVSVL